MALSPKVYGNGTIVKNSQRIVPDMRFIVPPQHIDSQKVGITPAAMGSARTAMIAALADSDGGKV
eukprot:1615088-Amphidinium_carterae.1